MLHSYSRAQWALRVVLLLAPVGAARAQAPAITSVIPMANAQAAARTSPVTVSFNQPLTAASAGALKVFSSQRGGLRSRGTTPAVVSGSALSFAPTAYPYLPGETVQYTVTTAAASSGGALARGRVGQFTAAAGGSGGGNFVAAPPAAVGNLPNSVAVGDADGDGDLDLFTTNFNPAGTVSVRLNDGHAAFGGTQEIAVEAGPHGLALGDVDGDGDLDLLAANTTSNTISVRLNNGSGTFGGTQEVAVGADPRSVVLGDVDGDGDLDALTASYNARTVSVRLNNGSGTFGGGSDVRINLIASAYDVVLGDVDNDGDLDLLTSNIGPSGAGNTIGVRLNDGTGSFSGTQNVAVGTSPEGLTVGDVDNDGDLDVVVANSSNGFQGTVSVRLNDGTGTFGGTQDIPAGTFPTSTALGDVDGDGDLDLLVVNTGSNTVSVRLNDGTGTFSGTQEVSAFNPHGVALGDLDGDRDLDLVANANPNKTNIYLNGGTGPLATAADHDSAALALFPNPARGVATLTGATPNAPVAVLDALGRVLLTAATDAAGAVRLALPAGLPAGVYLVRSGGQVRRLAVE